jgi:hypothetical protein
MFTAGDGFINMVKVSGLMTGFTGYDELYLNINEPLDKTVTASVDQFASNVSCACFNKGPRTYLVIANPSNSQQSFLINDNKLGRTDTVVRRYDENGNLINERNLRYEHMRNILQPGEFMIVEIRWKG